MLDSQKPALQTQVQKIDNSLKTHSTIGGLVIFLLLAGLGGWFAFSSIASAVIASGTIVVESNIKRVQHREGGIVGKIFVKNGTEVEAGSILIQLDDTLARANLAIITTQIDELLVRKDSLMAQRDHRSEIVFSDQVQARKEQDDIARFIKSERIFFAAVQKKIASEKSQLNERIGQLKEEIKGFNAQQRSKKKQLTIIRSEISGLNKLFKKGLVSKSRLLALQREAAKLDGEIGQLV